MVSAAWRRFHQPPAEPGIVTDPEPGL